MAPRIRPPSPVLALPMALPVDPSTVLLGGSDCDVLDKLADMSRSEVVRVRDNPEQNLRVRELAAQVLEW